MTAFCQSEKALSRSGVANCQASWATVPCRDAGWPERPRSRGGCGEVSQAALAAGDVKFAVQRRARLDPDRSVGRSPERLLPAGLGRFSSSGTEALLAPIDQIGQYAARHRQRQNQLHRQREVLPPRAKPRSAGATAAPIVRVQICLLPGGCSSWGNSLSSSNLFANRRIVFVERPPIVGPAGNVQPIGVAIAALGVEHVDQRAAAGVVCLDDAVANLGGQFHLLLRDRVGLLVGGAEVLRPLPRSRPADRPARPASYNRFAPRPIGPSPGCLGCGRTAAGSR